MGHYIGWESFIAARECGGAGVLYIQAWFEALTRKQAIRFLTEPGSCWVTHTRDKYKFRSWLHPTRKKNISAYWKILREAGPHVVGETHAVIANGEDTEIWNDVWLQGTKSVGFRAALG